MNFNETVEQMKGMPLPYLQQAMQDKQNPKAMAAMIALDYQKRIREGMPGAQPQGQPSPIKDQLMEKINGLTRSGQQAQAAMQQMQQGAMRRPGPSTEQTPQAMAQDRDQMGIGALQGPPQAFRHGGIVAFAGGGDVSEEDVRAAYDEWMRVKPSWYQQDTPMSSARTKAAEAEYDRLRQALLERKSSIPPPPRSFSSADMTRNMGKHQGIGPDSAGLASLMPQPAAAQPRPAGMSARVGSSTMSRGADPQQSAEQYQVPMGPSVPSVPAPNSMSLPELYAQQRALSQQALGDNPNQGIRDIYSRDAEAAKKDLERQRGESALAGIMAGRSGRPGDMAAGFFSHRSKVGAAERAQQIAERDIAIAMEKADQALKTGDIETANKFFMAAEKSRSDLYGSLESTRAGVGSRDADRKQTSFDNAAQRDVELQKARMMRDAQMAVASMRGESSGNAEKNQLNELKAFVANIDKALEANAKMLVELPQAQVQKMIMDRERAQEAIARLSGLGGLSGQPGLDLSKWGQPQAQK